MVQIHETQSESGPKSSYQRYQELVSKSLEGPLSHYEWAELRGLLPPSARSSWATRGGGFNVDRTMYRAIGRPSGVKKSAL